MNNEKNKEVRKEKHKEGEKTFISEVQEFQRPEGYEDAFKKYYPQQK
ncbi:hypothetical protein G9F71_011915 [Clostridium sp. FP2]|uniref:Uncharacterized protein n=1 Tax=Clostridium tagluense TaxID=360422 RepID=A0A401UL32_9CLOT|nr:MULTISPECIES: hypothetical protein [Clostridium]MBW9158296.1 hypothetical protein [Clostridium tagluense]MBZ9623557.1 hypothetical protein [Clostridium sp. FP2]WLC67715.1 hypothetical protein KTC93_11325 [Clostridium tagluense]GCD10247.1 hypothetical protein Ctaglu_18700 [Clostridium tagluense]